MAYTRPKELVLEMFREKIKEILIQGLQELYSQDYKNIDDGVSEMNLCSRLAHYMQCLLKCNLNHIEFEHYFVDVEYDRMGKDNSKRVSSNPRNIRCDLLIHSRGIKTQDNLLALEMKKDSNSSNVEEDKSRLKALTTWNEYSDDSFVCNTILGAFVTIEKSECTIDFFQDGEFHNQIVLPYNPNTSLLFQDDNN